MAYGANPAIANGEGDFPSDLPASLLVRRVKNLVSFSCTVDLNYMNLVNSKSPQNNNIHDYFAVQKLQLTAFNKDLELVHKNGQLE